jgi:hypothetical protein
MKGGDLLKDSVLLERVGGRSGEGKGETVDEAARGGRSGDGFADSVSGGDPAAAKGDAHRQHRYRLLQ